jgi:hypothetical protein
VKSKGKQRDYQFMVMDVSEKQKLQTEATMMMEQR